MPHREGLVPQRRQPQTLGPQRSQILADFLSKQPQPSGVTPFAGAADLGTNLINAFFKGQGLRQEQSEETARRQELAKALGPQTVEGALPAGGVGPGAPTQQPATIQSALAALLTSQDPELQQLGATQQLAQLGRQQEQQAVLGTETRAEQAQIRKEQRAVDQPTTAIKTLETLQERPDLAKLQLEQKRAAATKVNIAAQDTAETAIAKALAKPLVARVDDRITFAQSAVNQNNQLDRVTLALERGAQTGRGEETILNLRALGTTFLGLDFPEAASEQEIIRQTSNEMALRLRNPDSGLGLTGNTSNRDLIFLKDSVVGLARDEQSNRLMVQFMKARNNMTIAIADEQARIIGENGGIPPLDIDTQLLNFANGFELFTPEERAILEQEVQAIKGATGQEQQEQFTTPSGVPFRIIQ